MNRSRLTLYLLFCFVGHEGITMVAVKMLKENASEAEKKDLLSELEVSEQNPIKFFSIKIKLRNCIII